MKSITHFIWARFFRHKALKLKTKKSVTFTATLLNLFRRLDISLTSCSPAELVYVSI
jgi:hypothetical protein